MLRTTVTVLGAPLLAALLLAGCSQADGPVVLDPEPDLATQEAPAAQPTSPASPTPRTSPPARPSEPAVPTIAETVATGLLSPWGLAFLPDGRALVSERDTARVLRVSAAGEVREVGTVPDVAVGGEGGLLGLAVSSTFAQDRWVYAYHTAPGENRLVRMRLAGDRLGPPQVLLAGIPAAEIHNGGRIAFGPDGMLYVGTGDAADTALSPRPDTLAGKVLRLTPTGDVPADNPDPGSPVWSSGHRNVQGLAWGPDGTMYASEFGANTWDELNVIRPGRDYGWPSVEGAGGREQGFTDPIVAWPTDQASPSGIAVADGTVFLAALRGQRLWAVPVAGARAGEPQAWFTGELGRLRTVAVAPDGSVWLVTSNTDGRGVPGEQDDRILRLELG